MPTRSLAAKAEPARPASPASQGIAWSSFPHLSQAFAPSPESTVARLRGRAREHASREGTRSAAERTRVRAIAAAYTRTAALLEELEALRLQAVKKEATAGGLAR